MVSVHEDFHGFRRLQRSTHFFRPETGGKTSHSPVHERLPEMKPQRIKAMAFRTVLLLCWLLGLPAAQAAESPQRLCEPWQSEYRGEDATGKHVIALWAFEQGDRAEDASGRGHAGTIRGAKLARNGRFGSCLETFCGWPVEDKEHRAFVPSRPELSPEGPFTIEMWIRPKPELSADYPDAFLLDKKYVSDHDYQLILGPADRRGNRVVRACLGFGSDSSTYYSRPARFEPGTWYHLAFTYDGAGEGAFYLDGKPWGRTRIEGRQSIAAGKHGLSIGDRVGSYYHGFPGFIDQVRICRGVLEFRRAKLELVSPRSCFLRMESPAEIRLALTNLDRQPLAQGTLILSVDGEAERQVKVADLAPGGSMAVKYRLPTSLSPGAYPLAARLVVSGKEAYESREEFTIQIAPRKTPHQFPVLMWGVGSPEAVLKEINRLKEIGFTHVLGFGADYGRIWEAGKPTEPAKSDAVRQTRHMLDQALAQQITIAASLSPGHWLASKREFQRVDRTGQPYKTKTPDVCGLFPEVQQYCYNVGASVVQSYGEFPAFGAALLHTEVRDHATLCFHPHDLEAMRKACGIELPQQIGSRNGVLYTRLADFPASRVIPDNHPLYLYYRWYWKSGDGWNGLNTALHRGLKSTGRLDLWTWHDPAVRVASVYGSGGEVDVLSQWTYSYPDPIRIAVATDELLAMAGGGATGQKVMKMTQIIWYRSQTAPMPNSPAQLAPYQAPWERHQPEAPFITIAPMHLREAFWVKIARPICGIMYHGWQSLVPCDSPSSYCYTHPQTQHELASLIRRVIRPLGPTLLQVPGARSDVAFLESFASQMFARRGTYGWGGSWCGDAYHAMLYAHLQPEIVFDETVIQRGLEGFRVLVMPDCDVITQNMAQRIKAFQAQGGTIVGDERLAPAIKPDILLSSYQRTGRADRDKAAILAIAAQLRRQLDGRYTRYLDTDNPEVIPYLRRYREADYVFLVNDRREFGQYVGHHGLVMENGLPSKATLTINRPAGFVYDLLANQQLSARQQQGKMMLEVCLGPCDGAVYLVSPQAVDSLQLRVPETASRGSAVQVIIEVLDPQGQPVKAVLPVEVTIRDSTGRLAEFSGSYAAIDGRVEITLDIAPNEPFGVWQVEVRELASGRRTARFIRVAGPEPWPPTAPPVPKGATNPVQPQG